MFNQSHADHLKLRHQQLAEQIRQEMARPVPNQTLLSDLKRQKLQAKQEFEKFTRNH